MAATITFRPDADSARALAVLTSDGSSVSEALRSALVETANARVRARLREESAAVASDAEDRAEAARVLRAMESLRAW